MDIRSRKCAVSLAIATALAVVSLLGVAPSHAGPPSLVSQKNRPTSAAQGRLLERQRKGGAFGAICDPDVTQPNYSGHDRKGSALPGTVNPRYLQALERQRKGGSLGTNTAPQPAAAPVPNAAQRRLLERQRKGGAFGAVCDPGVTQPNYSGHDRKGSALPGTVNPRYLQALERQRKGGSLGANTAPQPAAAPVPNAAQRQLLERQRKGGAFGAICDPGVTQPNYSGHDRKGSALPGTVNPRYLQALERQRKGGSLGTNTAPQPAAAPVPNAAQRRLLERQRKGGAFGAVCDPGVTQPNRSRQPRTHRNRARIQ